MFTGYMTIDGTEILNVNRVSAYAEALAPGLTLRCTAPGLNLALRQSPYTTPARDNAPWYRVTRPATGRFLGVYPLDIEGLDDSTETITTNELTVNGGVFSRPRFGMKELRVIAYAVALDDEALEEGMAWLRSVLSNEGIDGQLGCTGRQVRMFSATPRTSSDATSLGRTFYEVEKVEGPLKKAEYKSRYSIIKIEFTLSAGKPWAWTDPTTVATLSMNSAANYTEPVEDCSDVTASYDNFINDPFFTAIAQPPKPPIIKPPNVLDLTSWRRMLAPIPVMLTERAGRAAPIITISAGATDAQYIRLRFYAEGTGNTGCDYDGEFLVSYLPANSVMSLNGITQEATVTLSDGRELPGGHLLYGTDGRPFLWPTLASGRVYTMTADMMPGQTDIIIMLDVAVRE